MDRSDFNRVEEGIGVTIKASIAAASGSPASEAKAATGSKLEEELSAEPNCNAYCRSDTKLHGPTQKNLLPQTSRETVVRFNMLTLPCAGMAATTTVCAAVVVGSRESTAEAEVKGVVRIKIPDKATLDAPASVA